MSLTSVAVCLRLWTSILIGVFTLHCGSNQPPDSGPIIAETYLGSVASEYSLSTHPLISEERAFALYSPIVDRLNQQIPGAHFRLETASDYPTFESWLYAGRYDFSITNPLQTLKAAQRGYHVFGKVKDDSQFYGIVLTLKRRKITKVAQLKGLTISYPASTALAACIMPQYFFYENGIDVTRDIKNLFTGNQESSIQAVVSGLSDVAVTWPPPWELYQRTRPTSAAQLKVLWQTPPLVNNGLVVRSAVPADVRAQVASVLFSLHNDKQGQRILEGIGYSGFEPASSTHYEPVEAFLRGFNARVRQIEELP